MGKLEIIVVLAPDPCEIALDVKAPATVSQNFQPCLLLPGADGDRHRNVIELVHWRLTAAPQQKTRKSKRRQHERRRKA